MKKLLTLLSLIIVLNVETSQAFQNPDFNPDKKHHRPDGFVNRYLPDMPKGNYWKWQWQRLTGGYPKKTPEEFRLKMSALQPDLEFIQNNCYRTAVTWIGHSTVLLQVDGVNILTDPHFGSYVRTFLIPSHERFARLNIKLQDLPHIDAVLISHNHPDHLNLDTVQKLMNQEGGPPKFFVPLGVQRWFSQKVEGTILEGENQNVFAMDWDDTQEIEGITAPVKIEFLAVQHYSGRTARGRNQTLWGSFAVLSPKFRFWFSGDLGYSQDTADIGKHLENVDLAAIAIGSYEPRWFTKNYHVNPEEAVRVMQDVHAKKALAIHFGTFVNLTDEPLDQPVRDLKTAIDAAHIDHGKFLVPVAGQTFKF